MLIHPPPSTHPPPLYPLDLGRGPQYSHSSGDSQGKLPFSRRTFDMKVGKIKEQWLLRGKGDGDRVTAVS